MRLPLILLLAAAPALAADDYVVVRQGKCADSAEAVHAKILADEPVDGLLFLLSPMTGDRLARAIASLDGQQVGAQAVIDAAECVTTLAADPTNPQKVAAIQALEPGEAVRWHQTEGDPCGVWADCEGAADALANLLGLTPAQVKRGVNTSDTACAVRIKANGTVYRAVVRCD